MRVILDIIDNNFETKVIIDNKILSKKEKQEYYDNDTIQDFVHEAIVLDILAGHNPNIEKIRTTAQKLKQAYPDLVEIVYATMTHFDAIVTFNDNKIKITINENEEIELCL